MSSHVWVSSLKNIYSSSSIYNNTSRDFKSDWIMTPIQPQIIRKYTPLTHVRECKAPWPFLQDKTTPLHMNALIWKGKSSRKMKGKKKTNSSASVWPTCDLPLKSGAHSNTSEKRSIMTSGRSWVGLVPQRRKSVQKTWERTRRFTTKKKKEQGGRERRWWWSGSYSHSHGLT